MSHVIWAYLVPWYALNSEAHASCWQIAMYGCANAAAAVMACTDGIPGLRCDIGCSLISTAVVLSSTRHCHRIELRWLAPHQTLATPRQDTRCHLAVSQSQCLDDERRHPVELLTSTVYGAVVLWTGHMMAHTNWTNCAS